jgi:hypothetical protein
MSPLDFFSPERSHSRRARWNATVLLTFVLLLVSSPARALPPFPGIVQETLDLACAPQCTLCHTSASPNLDNATQPFGLNVQSIMGSVTEAQLPAVLKALETQPCLRPEDPACANVVAPAMCGVCNGDGEGAGDIDEIRADLNPNNASDLACPRYGCGAHIAPLRATRSLDGTAALLALGVAAALVRRWRR